MKMKVINKEDFRKTAALVIGTRPGIIMFAPIIKEFERQNIDHFIIHTGQHYSPNMDTQFFSDLNLPNPKYKIENVHNKPTHGGQTAAMLEGVEDALMNEKPTLVLVGGDANTNLAGALAARKLRIKVGHVESGERSYDWRMPEEHNRRMIDHISDLLFTTNEKGKRNLEKESVQGQIFLVGNPIVDASLNNYQVAREKSTILREMALKKDSYAVLTTHREENVDFKDLLKGILQGVSDASSRLGLVTIFLAHPRTLKRLNEFDLYGWAESLPNLKINEAVGYLDFLFLLANARIAFTDSGGVQQEACIHRVPAVTVRENTEWTETLEIGANRLAGTDPDRIVQAAEEAYRVRRDWTVPFGDGKTAEKIVEICARVMEA